MDEDNIIIVKDFIEENWRAFSFRCEEKGLNPEEVIKDLETMLLDKKGVDYGKTKNNNRRKKKDKR